MAITAFLSRSPGLLHQEPEGLVSLGHVPHSSIFSPTDLKLWTPIAQSGVLRTPSAGCWFSLQHLSLTDLNFLSPGLYNYLTSTVFPASVTISHSIQSLDSQGIILIFLAGWTCYLHRCISYFDSLTGSEVNIQHCLDSLCSFSDSQLFHLFF